MIEVAFSFDFMVSYQTADDKVFSERLYAYSKDNNINEIKSCANDFLIDKSREVTIIKAHLFQVVTQIENPFLDIPHKERMQHVAQLVGQKTRRIIYRRRSA